MENLTTQWVFFFPVNSLISFDIFCEIKTKIILELDKSYLTHFKKYTLFGEKNQSIM